MSIRLMHEEKADTNNLGLSQSPGFVAVCGEFGIVPSAKQARQFRNKSGRLFDALNDRRLVQ